MLALRLLQSVLLYRASTTEYALTVGAVGLLVPEAPVLLELCRHPHRELRLRASDVLQALLLECEIGQFRLVQQLAAAQGALLWLLPLCFVGGARALAAVPPPPANFVEQEEEVARQRRRAAAAAAAAEAEAAALAQEAYGSGDGDGDDEDGEADGENGADGGGDGDAAGGGDGGDGGEGEGEGKGRGDGDDADGDDGGFESPAAVALPAVRRLSSVLRERGEADADGDGDGDADGDEGDGEAGEEEEEEEGAIEDGYFPGQHSEEGGRGMFRRLVALLCDDHDELLRLLGRALPSPLVSRHLRKPPPDQPPPDVATLLALLAVEAPAERAKLKALRGAERERYARSVKHLPALPLGAWHLFWEALASAHEDPDLVWHPNMATELQCACAVELAALDAEKREEAARGRRFRIWESGLFFVVYDGLRDELHVPPYYPRLLIDALDGSGGAAVRVPAGLATPAAAHAYLARLQQRCYVAPADSALLLQAMGAVYRLHAAAEPALDCVPYSPRCCARRQRRRRRSQSPRLRSSVTPSRTRPISSRS